MCVSDFSVRLEARSEQSGVLVRAQREGRPPCPRQHLESQSDHTAQGEQDNCGGKVTLKGRRGGVEDEQA